MYRVLILLFFLPMSSLVAQSGPRGEKGQALLWLDVNSKLTIFVSTNVNGFPCEFVSSTRSKALFIDYEAIDDNYVEIENAALRFPIEEFDCGQNIKNKEFRAFLHSDEYPALEIELNGLKLFEQSREGVIGEFISTVEVATHKRQEKINITDIISEAKASTYKGFVEINVRDYQLEPPVKFLGMVKVKEKIRIDFEFRFIGDSAN